MSLARRLAVWIATGFYIGNLPVAPGTFGALLGVLVWLGMLSLDPGLALAGVLGLTVLAVWTSSSAAKQLKQKDPGCIVIDEVVGMTITLFGLPFHWGTGLLGFILFRLLDIKKPFPIGWIDRRMSGGTGIVMDDVVAGIIGNITLRIILQLFELLK